MANARLIWPIWAKATILGACRANNANMAKAGLIWRMPGRRARHAERHDLRHHHRRIHGDTGESAHWPPSPRPRGLQCRRHTSRQGPYALEGLFFMRAKKAPTVQILLFPKTTNSESLCVHGRCVSVRLVCVWGTGGYFFEIPEYRADAGLMPG